MAHVWHTRVEMCHKRREPSAMFVQVRRYLSLRAAGLRPTFNPPVVGSSPTGPTPTGLPRQAYPRFCAGLVLSHRPRHAPEGLCE